MSPRLLILAVGVIIFLLALSSSHSNTEQFDALMKQWQGEIVRIRAEREQLQQTNKDLESKLKRWEDKDKVFDLLLETNRIKWNETTQEYEMLNYIDTLGSNDLKREYSNFK